VQVISFRADLLPKGLQCDPTTGSISGVPDQVDTDFVSYFVLAANEVGLATTEIRFLVDKARPAPTRVLRPGHCIAVVLTLDPPVLHGGQAEEHEEAEEEEAGGEAPTAEAPADRARIVNMHVEARIGQKVQGTRGYLRTRDAYGLPDGSAAGPRDAADGRRCETLVMRSRELRDSAEWHRILRQKAYSKLRRRAAFLYSEKELSSSSSDVEEEDDDTAGDEGERDRIEFVQADARGTIVNVSRDGDYCQVLWDSTGLIGTYNTGHAGAYSLMLWTTRERLLQAWLAIPDRTRRTLHDDLLWCAPP
jgi:hypothetical protein